MKKAVSLSIIVALCVSLLMTFTSCSSKHPIDEFKEKLEKADSYQAQVTMSDVPLFGTITMITKIDGNIQYTPAVMLSEEQYIETVGDTKYKYTKDDSGKWIKEKEETDDDSGILDDELMKNVFNPDNYEKVKDEKNTYKQKSDVTFDDYEDVIITIKDDLCTVEMKSISDGMVCGVKIEFSKINEIELTLPQVG